MGSLTAEYSGLNINPSTADDQQIIEHLRLIKAGPVVEPDLTKLQPSDLPRCFPLSSKHVPGTREKAWETQHGSWKFKGGSFSAVTIGAVGLTKHVGAKRTMEFYQNGTATDWVMDQYFVLVGAGLGLLMEVDVTLCHVYQQKRKGPLNEKEYLPKQDYWGNFVPEDYDEGDGLLLPCLYDFSTPFFDEYLNSQNQQAANNQEAVLPKTKRKSDVWNDFTKVYVKDPGGKLKLEYAICNSCHMLLRAPSSNGTKSLWSHTGTCRCKRLQQQTE